MSSEPASPGPSPRTAAQAPPLVACGHTHPGQARGENEDAFGVWQDLRLFAVADGMGGRTGGAIAARMAVDVLEIFVRERHAHPRAPWPFPMDRGTSLGANLLRVGLQVANQKICAAVGAEAGPRRMGATFAALTVGVTQIVIAHAGDVRAYRVRGNSFRRLTRDHSLYEEMLAARPQGGTEDLPAAQHRNVVTRALGIRDSVEPTVYVNSFLPGDLYLLCSDGLWGVLPDARLAQMLTGAIQIETACHALVDAANEAGAPDNVTALLVRVG